MIEVEIPNDISEYETKVFFGLTGRQIVFAGIAGAICILLFRFVKPLVGEATTYGLMCIPAVIAALFGWYKPYGMNFEQYLKSALTESLLAPKIRKAKTTSVIVPCDKNYKPIADSEVSKEVLECVNYVREKTGIEVEQENKKIKKTRYKKSKSAMK